MERYFRIRLRFLHFNLRRLRRWLHGSGSIALSDVIAPRGSSDALLNTFNACLLEFAFRAAPLRLAATRVVLVKNVITVENCFCHLATPAFSVNALHFRLLGGSQLKGLSRTLMGRDACLLGHIFRSTVKLVRFLQEYTVNLFDIDKIATRRCDVFRYFRNEYCDCDVPMSILFGPS